MSKKVQWGMWGGLLALWGVLVALARPPEAPPPPPVERFAAWWPRCEAQQQPALPPWMRQRLAQVARRYLAPTAREAETVAQWLGFTEQAHPSNMCGPLAVAILRDAEVVQTPEGLAPYWLLDPRTDGHLLYRLFPPERFCYRHFREGPFQMDFRDFPLQPGDFLYLYAGSWGTFEHILVVTRVDEQGRAYTVTNINLHPRGVYVVREALLYDPNRPGLGLFYDWASPRHALIGLTGLGGFDLWRPLPGVWDVVPRTPRILWPASWPWRRPLPRPH